MEKVKTLVIDSDPVGYTAAIYTGRVNIRPVLYSGLQPDGQLATTTIIENFSGFHGRIGVNQLMLEMREQAKFYSTNLRDGSIVKTDLSSRSFHLEDERGNQIEAETVIIAIGASVGYLGLPDEKKYRGQGVSVCATCDDFFCHKRTIAVVGGDDTACEEAMYLSGLTEEAYMIVRKPQLCAAEITRRHVTGKENIEVLYNASTLGLSSEDGVRDAHLVRFRGEENEEKFDISIDGFFSAIGHTPNTDLFKGQLKMNDHGFIITKPKPTATNIGGVFTTGDVADPACRQGVVTAGTGVMAAIEVGRFLQKQ